MTRLINLNPSPGNVAALADSDIPATIARDAEVSAAIASHTSATDPHPIYLTQPEGDGRYRQTGVALADTDIPATIARDAEVSAAIASHASATDPHTQYLPTRPVHIEFGLAPANIIDFHGGTSEIDFDVRIFQSGGIGQSGRGNLAIQANKIDLLCLLSLNNTANLHKILCTQTYIELPAIASQGVYDIYVSVPGASNGDVVFFCPLANLYNGLWTFNIQAAVIAGGVVQIYFHNLYNTSVDVAGFSAKVIVLGVS